METGKKEMFSSSFGAFLGFQTALACYLGSTVHIFWLGFCQLTLREIEMGEGCKGGGGGGGEEKSVCGRGRGGRQECVHMCLCLYHCMTVDVTFAFPDKFRLLYHR